MPSCDDGVEGARTPNPRVANAVLFQLSYDPFRAGDGSDKCGAWQCLRYNSLRYNQPRYNSRLLITIVILAAGVMIAITLTGPGTV
jgi:hypothetical protein